MFIGHSRSDTEYKVRWSNLGYRDEVLDFKLVSQTKQNSARKSPLLFS